MRIRVFLKAVTAIINAANKAEFAPGSPIQLSVPNIVRLPAYSIGLLLKGSCLHLVVEFAKGEMKITYRVTPSYPFCCSVHQLVSVNES